MWRLISVMFLVFLACVSLAQAQVVMDIDVKPDSDVNPVNVQARGVVPVALLCSDVFDPLSVVSASLAFGPNGTPALRCAPDDVNADGCIDLMCQFDLPAGFVCDPAMPEVEAVVTGQTVTGDAVQGADAVRLVGCAKAEHPGQGKGKGKEK